ncbi:MAG: hypothetical protein LBO80_01485 [Treponema sp.]|jgi:hypothetical protein|nr:hypothetical protein [Treponema sp.]
MADRRFFLLPLFFLLPAFLPGQELPPPEAGGSFYIERTGEEERFIQRLVWEKADYAYRYEITIEEQSSSGEYAEIRRESRTENFIELSLAPGLYRYQIEVYNLLNRPAGISGWIPFRVFPALQPELYSFRQELTPSGEGDPQGGMEIILQGMNLTEGAEVRLQPADGGGDITPLAYLPLGESARLVFNRETLAPGRYRVYVRNPGGLEGSLEITVSPPLAAADSPAVPPVPGTAVPSAVPEAGDAVDVLSPLGVYISAEYAPLIPFYGYLFTPFDHFFYPWGASLRVGFTPVKQSWGDLGLELAPSWNMLNSGAVKLHAGSFYLNGLYQWRFFKRTMALVFRLGAGISFVYGTGGDQDSGSIFTWMISAGGGIFLRWFMPVFYNFRRITHSTFYLETGAEYNHLFTKDVPAGYVKPVLGIGWNF